MDIKRSNILKILPTQPIYFLKAGVSASSKLHCIPQSKSQMFELSFCKMSKNDAAARDATAHDAKVQTESSVL